LISPDLKVLMEQMDSRYTLVVAAAKRARQLADGGLRMTRFVSDKPVTLAIHEIAEGKIAYSRSATPKRRPQLYPHAEALDLFDTQDDQDMRGLFGGMDERGRRTPRGAEVFGFRGGAGSAGGAGSTGGAGDTGRAGLFDRGAPAAGIGMAAAGGGAGDLAAGGPQRGVDGMQDAQPGNLAAASAAAALAASSGTAASAASTSSAGPASSASAASIADSLFLKLDEKYIESVKQESQDGKNKQDDNG
jgi:DNA-directed RNA polymerase subunit omega